MNKKQVVHELQKLKNMPDEKIDYSDIGAFDFKKLGAPICGKFYKPIKKSARHP